MGNLLRNNHNSLNLIRKIHPSTSEHLFDLNNKQAKYSNNSIRTQKYSILTFIPKNLYEQLHRFANIYFIFILILNFLPEIKAFGKEVAPIPVLFVLSVTAIKDLVEDYRRYQSDKRVNYSFCDVYNTRDKVYCRTKWKDVHCGDFIKLRANDTIPADMLVLYSSDRAGICHIETSNLDGESNLKQRDVVQAYEDSSAAMENSSKQQIFSPEMFRDCYLEVEHPNKEIYKFHGTLYMKRSNDSVPLRKNNLILRGCTLRNTEEVVGMVVYAGKETKAMLNNNETRFKRSKLERQINKDVIWCALILIVLCLSISIGSAIWNVYNADQKLNEYFKFPDNTPDVLRNPAMQAFIVFWTCVIYYQAMIPLPLYVTFEFVKLHQVFHIRNDLEMYDPSCDKGLEVRAFNIPEDLGQIQYVFCDKTGTLTENRMEFKRACIVGSNSPSDFVHEPSLEPDTVVASTHDTTLNKTQQTPDKPSLANGDIVYQCNQTNFRPTLQKHQSSVSTKSIRLNAHQPMSALESILHSNEDKYLDSGSTTGIDHSESQSEGDDGTLNKRAFHQNVRDFFMLMAICNTTVVSTNKNENKPIIKHKKPDLRSKMRRNIQLAGEGFMNKANSISNFMTKSGRLSFTTSANPNSSSSTTAETSVYHCTETDALGNLRRDINTTMTEDPSSVELRKFQRRDSNAQVFLNPAMQQQRPCLNIVLEQDTTVGATTTNTDSTNNHLPPTNLKISNSSRKVHSVVDLTSELFPDNHPGSVSTLVHSEMDHMNYLDINKDHLNCHSNTGSITYSGCDYSDMGPAGIDSSGRSTTARSHRADTTTSTSPVSPHMSDGVLMDSYESESPDEIALVKTACYYGYKLLQRGPNFVTIWNPALKKPVHYQILQILPFDSVRKRMSIVVQWPKNKQIVLLCKGADSAMFGRFNKSVSDFQVDNMKDFVDEYARLGLRTLVMSKRVLSRNDYDLWLAKYSAAEAKMSLENNEVEMQQLMDELESEMQLLGVTGIEDCLQEGVTDTILSLRAAGITVWVLTGDKRETAINIAYSAGLFSDSQNIINIKGTCKEEVEDLIKQHLCELERHHPENIVELRQGHKRPLIRPDIALCIDGEALTFALQQDMKLDFLHLAEQCSSVVCARSTPLQKAEVVLLVKENLRMQTLAIGDGANDVSMIQTADVGVGIGGREGMQAVMASDFSMSKFRFLKRLLLVHGSWAYNKLSRTALYMFYKDTIYILLMFWYQFHNAFSTSVMIDQITQILFNITMTGLPPIIYGIWDKDLCAETLMKNPELYRHGVNCKTYRPWHFWANIIDSIYQSLVIFYITFLIYNGSDVGIWQLGYVIAACALITVLAHIGIETRFWTGFHVLGFMISIFVAYVGFTILYQSICSQVVCNGDNPQNFLMENFMQLRFWVSLVVAPCIAVMPRLVITAVKNTLDPDLLSQGLQYQQQYGRGAKFPLDLEPELVPVDSVATHRPLSWSNGSATIAAPSKELISPVYGDRAVSKAHSLVSRNTSIKSQLIGSKPPFRSSLSVANSTMGLSKPPFSYGVRQGDLTTRVLNNNGAPLDDSVTKHHRRVKSYDNHYSSGRGCSQSSHDNIYIIKDSPYFDQHGVQSNQAQFTPSIFKSFHPREAAAAETNNPSSFTNESTPTMTATTSPSFSTNLQHHHHDNTVASTSDTGNCNTSSSLSSPEHLSNELLNRTRSPINISKC